MGIARTDTQVAIFVVALLLHVSHVRFLQACQNPTMNC